MTLEAGDFVLLPATPGLHPVELRAGDAARASTPRPRPRRPRRFATAAATGRPTCACSAATSSSTRPTRRCWCRCCRALVHVRGIERLSTLVRLVGEEAGERRSGRDLDPGAPRRGAADRGAALDPVDGAPPGPAARPGRRAARGGDPADAWRSRAALDRRRAREGRRALRARPSSTASRAPSACGRWNTCSPGAWPSRRICSAAAASRWTRSPRASAMARRARSAPPSAATSASLRGATRVKPPPNRRRLKLQRLFPAIRYASALGPSPRERSGRATSSVPRRSRHDPRCGLSEAGIRLRT